MRRISPVLVLLVAAGCAQAGISEWLNPFSWKHNKPHGGGQPGSPSGVQHSPKPSGHRGTRQLYNGPPTGHGHGQHSHGPQASPQLGSPPGHLDDGFKPSFPPGFANPPSHSPNLNPFATSAGQGSEILGKGPFLPSQLTTYHTPNPPPHTPLVKPAPAPSPGGHGPRHRGRIPFLGGKGRRPSHSPVSAHHAVDSGSSIPDGSGPIGPDGEPVAYSEFPGLSNPMNQPQQPEYEETPTTPPESAPQRAPRRPQSLFSRLTGRRPSGPPQSHHNSQNGRNPQYGGGNGNSGFGGGNSHFGGGNQHHGFGPGGPGGPPQGGPSGPGGSDGPSFLDGSGPESQNPFGGANPFGSGPPAPQGRPGADVFYAGSPGSSQPFAPSIPDQGPQGPSPFGSPQSLGGGPSQYGGPSPFGSPQSGGPGGPGGPYGGGPGGPGGPYGGYQSGGPSPYNNPQYQRGPFGGGPGGPGGRPGQGGPSSLFGSEGGPQGGPPSGGPGGAGGAPNFFSSNGNDYPEQFEGGPRDVRQQQGGPQGGGPDFRPHPNGPPETAGADEQSPGFYGALHSESGPSPSSNFFGGNQQGSPGGPPSYDSGSSSPYGPGGPGGPGGPPQGLQGPGGNLGIYGSANAPGGYQQNPRGRKPPFGVGLRNSIANAFQSVAGSNNVQSTYSNPLTMSASGIKPTSLPVPKGSRFLRPFHRKPGGIIPLSSPKDPNYRPMRLGASTLNPSFAAYEPDTAASGGFHHHGAFGDGGLTHNGDRILYHVAGHKGPYSYRFGFDTGKGYNRLFRFEEKDGKGYVTGKYGFYDKSGKLNVINYQAHPQHGYHAERGHSHGLY